MDYRKSWNLRSIPDDLIIAERNRRISVMRGAPPRAKVMRPCAKCGKEFGARELRTHLPVCKSPRAKKGAVKP